MKGCNPITLSMRSQKKTAYKNQHIFNSPSTVPPSHVLWSAAGTASLEPLAPYELPVHVGHATFPAHVARAARDSANGSPVIVGHIGKKNKKNFNGDFWMEISNESWVSSLMLGVLFGTCELCDLGDEVPKGWEWCFPSVFMFGKPTPVGMGRLCYHWMFRTIKDHFPSV